MPEQFTDYARNEQSEQKQENQQERLDTRPLSAEDMQQQLEQTDKAIGLTRERLTAHIFPQLTQQQQKLTTLSPSIRWDDHLWPQATQLHMKNELYLKQLAQEASPLTWPSLGAKAKEKWWKGTDVTLQVGDIALSKEMKATPYVWAHLPNQGDVWGIAWIQVADKKSGMSTDLKGEFKEKGKPGKEYISAKITDQTKVALSKSDSISFMWGIDDRQPTVWAWYAKKLDTGTLTIWGTVTDTEKGPVNLKGDVTRTSKNKQIDITWTVQRSKGDITGWVSAKVRF
jgi:hypothetical protein